MPRPYSEDLRARVIEEIEAGASRREAAERYELSPSVVVIWARRWEETGSVAAKPSGGSTSPLEEHAGFLLGLVVEQPASSNAAAVQSKGVSFAIGWPLSATVVFARRIVRRPEHAPSTSAECSMRTPPLACDEACSGLEQPRVVFHGADRVFSHPPHVPARQHATRRRMASVDNQSIHMRRPQWRPS